MIRNRRFSRFNENRGLCRRFNEEVEVGSNDLRMVGAVGVKFHRLATKLAKELDYTWNKALESEYGSNYQIKLFKQVRSVADEIFESWKELMYKQTLYMSKKYGIRINNDLMLPGYNPEDKVEGGISLLSDLLDTKKEFGLYKSSKMAVGDFGENPAFPPIGMMKSILQEANAVSLAATAISNELFDIIEYIND